MTASAGIAALDRDGAGTAEAVLAAADMAMYEAKHAGRDRVMRVRDEQGEPAGPDAFMGVAGLGSFSSLRALPINYLKIDGEFVRGIARSPVEREIVKAIVALARAAGRRTIAEFVADQETLDLLTEIGADLAQGFHIGRPRPLEELL